ncbi:MAG TPA: glycosyltransferase family 4 protein [Saprospiraceae bacterium]|nr:glycosyltransferase family 4 protein [Saprospiraceae bacterium]HMP13356.1 glycosyltransferase family 4 protein [Saprospiraceae bacterium]
MPIKALIISSYQEAINVLRPEGEMLIGLHRTGEVEVDIMTQGDSEYAQLFREAGMRVIDFHPTKKFDQQSMQFIRQTLVEGGHQILHLFNNKAIINGIRAARKLPVKVVTYRGYTGNIHWWDPTCYLTHLHPRVNKITCLADSVKEVLDRNLIFRKSGVTVTVNKGHQHSWYANIQPADLQEFKLPPDAFVLSFVANARRMKGIPYLLEAMRILPPEVPIHLLMIGRGLDTPAHLQLLKGSPNQAKVHFAGYRRNALELVQACHAAVSASIFGEATPKAVLEGLFLGKPSIFTDIPGTKGMGIPGETALIVPPRNAQALATAMLELWQDPEHRARLGKAGLEYISTRFTTERSVRELLEVYQNLVNE